MADGIPVYEVKNDANKKRQVLHHALLLLGLAKPEGKPFRINCILIESGLTGAELVMPLRCSVKLGVVPCKLIYGLNTAMFKSRTELSGLMTGDDAHRVLTEVPWNWTGHRIPCDKHFHQRNLRVLLGDISAWWLKSTRQELEAKSYRGAGNGMSWPLMEALDTHIPGLLLTTCYENCTNAGHWNEPATHFLCPP